MPNAFTIGCKLIMLLSHTLTFIVVLGIWTSLQSLGLVERTISIMSVLVHASSPEAISAHAEHMLSICYMRALRRRLEQAFLLISRHLPPQEDPNTLTFHFWPLPTQFQVSTPLNFLFFRSPNMVTAKSRVLKQPAETLSPDELHTATAEPCHRPADPSLVLKLSKAASDTTLELVTVAINRALSTRLYGNKIGSWRSVFLSACLLNCISRDDSATRLCCSIHPSLLRTLKRLQVS
ncbi:hypothetical protein AUEXF2481DRAFT_459085 [Aureobasidium subglaciale EXF-2481]|uniref:Uncharacterized protein n=1 Tax=Aureobasidium subglaciale (strain EXF-2481) TaxID=1043005 RepID=A0A074YC58_AURSE|nr:uncharacterized protein AUEXF2481DRAFT_459085 [Aureobasidium subglaciale EXF-2481]KEQ91712.1 hypothetical protein AUEXF2481DRAFT_459085 [Aureobasidium subglaciale EXF-2481]